MRQVNSTLRRGTCVAVALLLAGACLAQTTRPQIGLAGNKYKNGYVPVCERLGADAVQIPGADLEDVATLSAYDAIVAVTRGDAGQEEYGFTEAAQAALSEYVAGGGRLLCTYGCAPPAQIIGGSYVSFNKGPDWRVANNDHPITRGMDLGQVVVYGAYRGGVSGIDERATVLLEEFTGAPAAFVVEYGEGCVLFSCGDLAYAGSWDGTAGEFRDRMMTYLIYGKAQERFGPPLKAPRTTAREWPRVVTPRLLGAEETRSGATLIRPDLSAPPAGPMETRGYGVESIDGAWRVTAPPGEGMFAPWISIPLGSAEAEPGKTYRLSARARMISVPASAPATGYFLLRFYNIDGIEIPHRDITTEAITDEAGTDLQTQAVAPEGVARVTAEMTLTLPTGSVNIEAVEVARAETAEEQFAAETPLELPAEHPRAVMSATAAADFPRRMTVTDAGEFGASPADMFASIRTRADGYLEETEIAFGKDQTLPWPPSVMPQEGGGLSWNPLAGALAERLQSLSVAYAGTGDVRYGNRAKELLLALCEWEQWYDPTNGYFALELGNISIGVGFAHDLCYDLLSDEERAFTAQAIQRNTLLPLYSKLFAEMGNSNGYALWATAMGLCALSVHGDVPGASRCIRLAEDCALDYFDQRATNHRAEAQGYDAWAYGLQIFLLEALGRNFGADHLDHPFFPTMIDFGTAFMANDRNKQAWFADAGGSVAYVAWHFPATMLGSWTGDPDAGWYLKETQTVGLRGHDHMKLLAYDPAMPVAASGPATTGAVFPRVGWASLRSDWERDGVFVALASSSSGQGHCHMDQNNFLIYDGPRMLAMDCGYASALGAALREFARGAVGHNCILVDGKMQIAKRGSIPFCQSTDALDYAMGDATPAYSSALVERAQRHLILIKPRLLLVVDDLRAAGGAREFQWLLHPHSWEGEGGLAAVTRDGVPIEVGAAPAPGDVDIVKDGYAMKVRFLAPQGMASEYVTYPGAEKYNAYLQANAPKAERTVLVTLIEIGDVEAVEPAAVVTGDGVVFTAEVDGEACELRLRLAGDGGQSPRLRYEVGGNVVLDLDDLAVPADAEG